MLLVRHCPDSSDSSQFESATAGWLPKLYWERCKHLLTPKCVRFDNMTSVVRHVSAAVVHLSLLLKAVFINPTRGCSTAAWRWWTAYYISLDSCRLISLIRQHLSVDVAHMQTLNFHIFLFSFPDKLLWGSSGSARSARRSLVMCNVSQ